jgi:hypothetical protein
MSRVTERGQLRVVCTECAFSRLVEKGGDEPAAVIVEHGRETGHKLRTEAVPRGE